MVDAKINLPIYDPEKCRLFALGRNAMYAGCIAMGLKEDDEVLTPAFDCDSALQPFRILRMKEIFYRSDPYTFSVSIEDIKSKITSKTRLIHIINHFGMPQPWDDLLKLRWECGIPILEDNAYSLFSTFDDKNFGFFGDMSIFSLRKNLPLVNGGMLKISSARYVLGEPDKPAGQDRREERVWLLRSIAKKAGLKPLIRMFFDNYQAPPPVFSDRTGYPDLPGRDVVGAEFKSDYLRPISEMALAHLGKFGDAEIINISERKRYYYGRLVEELKGLKGIRIIWPELPEGIVPFCLSMLIDSKRDIFLQVLRKKYDVMAWPTLSRRVLERLHDFPEVELLGKKLLQINLPSDEVVKDRFALYIGNLVKDIRSLADRHR